MLSSMQFCELFNKYLRWSRSRAKVTAPAKYPGSGSETLVVEHLTSELVVSGCGRAPDCRDGGFGLW